MTKPSKDTRPKPSKKVRISDSNSSEPKKDYSPFIFTRDVDESELDDILIDDGHMVSKSVEVVQARSKVSTEFSKSKVYASNLDGEKNTIGKKTFAQNTHSIKDLRTSFSSIIKRFSRKFVTFVTAGVLIGAILVSIGSTWIVRIWNNTPEIESRPFQSSIVYARDGTTELFKYFKEERREIVDICTEDQEKTLETSSNCIPKNVQLALIALEDENFYYNEDGIPWSNIAGATFDCLKSVGDKCRGGSGLSQQLVKNVTNENDFTIERKVTELLTAIKLNQSLDKQKILYNYLNQVAFGRNAYGVQEASKTFFGKNVKDVNTAEACYIASLVQKPTTFSESINNPQSFDYFEYEARKNICLEKLSTLKLQGSGSEPLLTKEDYEELKEFQPVFVENKFVSPYPHFRDYVTKELAKFNLNEQALATEGYKIITTIDPVIQKKSEDAIANLKQTSVYDNGANNASALVLDGPTGEIRAMIGSIDYYNKEIDGQVNIATSPQQPGSSIKPYVYAAALNQGFNPGTILMDVPTTFDGGFRPKNYSGGFSGAVSIRNALQSSYNLPAVKAAYLAAGTGDLPNGSAGINEVFRYSEATGLRYPCIDGAFNNNPIFANSVERCKVDVNITKEIIDNAYKSRCYVGSAIGGCEVTMVSHATGMNTFAQDGNLRTATPFISITKRSTGDGEENKDIYKINMEGPAPIYPKIDQVIDPLIARQMTAIMSDYQARYRVFGTRLASNLELEGWDGVNAVAAKTGTTDQVRDTWTVGYSPYYTVTVWVGNTDNSPMKDNATSASAPAPIWKAIMTSIHEGLTPKGGSREGLLQVRLNPASGLPVETGGYIELLTPSQNEVLQKAMQIASKPDFDPLKSSIFTTRSTVIRRRIKINTVDGKIADPLKTLEINTKEIVCDQVLSEFPLDAGWNAGVRPSSNCPNEISTQDQFTDQGNVPTIATNLQAANVFKQFIVINASAVGDSQKGIKTIELFIDGQMVNAVSSTTNLTFPITPDIAGKKDIKILVTDTWGGVRELVIAGATLEV